MVILYVCLVIFRKEVNYGRVASHENVPCQLKMQELIKCMHDINYSQLSLSRLRLSRITAYLE